MCAVARVAQLERHLVSSTAAPDQQLPIFVCSVVVPGIKNKFHIFEPRYRLLFQHILKDRPFRCGVVSCCVVLFGLDQHLNPSTSCCIVPRCLLYCMVLCCVMLCCNESM